MPERVLVTGHNGYIGSVMVPVFLQAGYEVIGYDTGYFRECTIIPDTCEVPTINKDIRDLSAEDLEGFQAVVHLAALSNDPIGNLRQNWTEEINHQSSVRLAELAKSAGVRRFLFSSSCIMYGMSSAEVVNEESPLDPQTEYARSKVKSERAISSLAAAGFAPVFLRNGTIYGLSPHMRFDTVFNDLMGSAATTGKVIVYSDGKPWRPVIHVKDVARAFLTVFRAPTNTIHNQAFNIGSNDLNYRVIQLAEIAKETVPGCELEVKAQKGADQRTYKADFTKFKSAFPGFEFEWTPRKGADELYSAFRSISLNHAVFVDKRFTRLKWLNYLLETGRLDDSLRWSQPPDRRDGGGHHSSSAWARMGS
jgi:nucleoside-diphosphate-sugar epimerase